VRTIGLAMIFVGTVAIVLPAYRTVIPNMPFDEVSLHILGAAFLIVGGASLWVTRDL
jgi:hypothetical protein